MAKTSMIANRCARRNFGVRSHNRCRVCGRPRGYLAEVRHVPHLLPRERAQRRRSRRDQGVVVGRRSNGYNYRSHCRHADAHSQRQHREPQNGRRSGVALEAGHRAESSRTKDSSKASSASSEGPQGTIRIALKYGPEKEKVITGLRRISRPGLRVYTGKTEIPRVLGGFGLVIMSTPQGIMSGKRAKKLGVGGEVLAYVW